MKTIRHTLSLLAAAALAAGLNSLPASAGTTTCSTAGGVNCSARIPDAVGATVTPIVSTMSVAACPAGVISNGITATVNISHTWVGDLQITLTNPSATTVTLVSNLADDTGSIAGCQGNNVNATFADAGTAPLCSTGLTGTLKPLSPMTAFGAAPVNGTWTLTVKDTQASSDGTLNDWSVTALCRIGDIDSDGAVNALTDGLLLLRYLFGITGAPLTANATGPSATRTDPVQVKAYLDSVRAQFDIDGNGSTDALSDGLMYLRYLFGLRGASLINGAIGNGATRTTSTDIENYILTLIQ